MPRARRLAGVAALTCALVAPLLAHTRPGLVVLYPTRDAVYLQIASFGEPEEIPRLEDGRYVFQVTEPSGKALLSSDPASCRQFDVTGGAISGVAAMDCAHMVRVDPDRGATTIQLTPYKAALNRGGMYRAWIVKVDDFLSACAALGVPDGLAVVNCGFDGDNVHGFRLGQSKSYHFKVRRG